MDDRAPREFDSVLADKFPDFDSFRDEFLARYKIALEANTLPHIRMAGRIQKSQDAKTFEAALFNALRIFESVEFLKYLAAVTYFEPHMVGDEGGDFQIFDEINHKARESGLNIKVVSDNTDMGNPSNMGTVTSVGRREDESYIDIDIKASAKNIGYQLIHEVLSGIVLYYFASMYNVFHLSTQELKARFRTELLTIVPVLELLMQVKSISELIKPVSDIKVASSREGKKMFNDIMLMDTKLPDTITT